MGEGEGKGRQRVGEGEGKQRVGEREGRQGEIAMIAWRRDDCT